MLVLGLGLGGLALLLLDEGGTVDQAPLESGADPEGGPVDLMTAEKTPVISTAGDAWALDILHDGRPIGDSRIIDIQVVSPDGESWIMTGEKLVDILEEELSGMGVRVVFKDEAALAEFKDGVFPVPIPSRAHMGMLLEICPDIGFRAVRYGDAIYVGKLPARGEEPQAPRDQELPPDEPPSPERPK
jgi:hypothetical protein